MSEHSKPRQSSSKSRSGKPHKEIRFGSYVLGSTLGEGEFGKVKLGWKKDSNQPSQVAIKFIRRDSIPRGSERESKVHREINALKRLSHPNIIRLEEVLQNDKYIGIVLEYASGGELFDYILSQRYLKDSFACKLFAQLVSGVHYMHSKGIVHRDLKLENLLLDKNKNIIITDFGFVNSFSSSNELMKTSCGSPCYAAPELVISSEPYEARKVDVWSCGVILYAMLAGYLPFDDDPQNPEGDNIARLYHYITTTNLTFPEYVEPMPRDLLRRVLVSNPKRRISLREVRNHQWLSPHAPYLSVTPSEWDENLKSRKDSTTGPRRKSDNRRHSLIETAGSSKGLPLPPQTSSNFAIALPSSTSSTSISEYVRYNTTGGHKRSSSVQSVSSASIALQAVVDANDKAQDKNGRGSGSLSPQLQQTHIPRSTTHTGISTINTTFPKDTIIEESPQKPLPVPLSSRSSKTSSSSKPFTAVSPTSGFAVPRIPLESSSQFSPKQQHPAKLPGPGTRKPRPTSYHPSLYTSHEFNGSNVQHSAPAFEFPKASFARSESPSSVSSLNNANISKPYVDLSSAEGDIIVPKSPNLISATLEHASVSERIEKPEAKPIETTEVPKQDHYEGLAIVPPPTPPPQSYIPLSDDPSSGISRSESYRSKKTNRYSALLGGDMFDKLFGSGSSENKPEISRSASRHSSIRSNSSKPSTLTKHTTISESSRNPSASSKIPQSTTTQSATSANKSKRFSFLGFYNSSAEDEPIVTKPTSAPTNKKKALEISNTAIVQTNTSSLQKQPSIIEYTSFQQRKEPSTAKKVFDYLKRRSMRAG